MHSDSYFTIGRTHKICEDYALHGKTERDEIPYAFVSDGCSSSPHTDVGARILCHTGLELLECCGGEDEFAPEEHARDAAGIERGFGKQNWEEKGMLDATLLRAHAIDRHVHVYMTGDGVVAGLRHDGTIAYWQVSFIGNAPAYLSYLVKPERWAAYIEAGGGYRYVTHKPTLEAAPEETSEQLEFDGPTEWHKWYGYSYTDTDPDSNFVLHLTFPRSEFKVVALFTDGIESFECYAAGQSRPARVPMEDVLREIMAFKNFAGEFVTRRCNKFFTKTCVENEWKHYDDFAMAAIYCGE